MKTPTLHLHTAALAVLLVCSKTVSASNDLPYTPPADDAVAVTGWVHVEDLSFDATTVELEVNGEVQRVPLSNMGRFDLVLPADAHVVLRFEHPGHLPKEVLVDTHHARAGMFREQTRHVRFAVIMELKQNMAGFTYVGPVGNIGFDKDGGCVAVDHTRKLMVGRKNQPMVF